MWKIEGFAFSYTRLIRQSLEFFPLKESKNNSNEEYFILKHNRQHQFFTLIQRDDIKEKEVVHGGIVMKCIGLY